MAKHATPQIKAKAKRLYMDGHTFAEVGRLVGYGPGALKTWSNADTAGSWRIQRQAALNEVYDTVEVDESLVTGYEGITASIVSGKGVNAAAPPSVTETVATIPEVAEVEPVVVGVDPAEVDQLRAENEALLAKNEELTRRAQAESKTFDLSLYLSDPVAWMEETHGTDYWDTLAQAAFKSHNLEARTTGMPIVDLKQDPAWLAEKVDELKAEEQARQDRPITSAATRRLKMVVVKDGKPARIVQIPLEPQVNNYNGSLADPIVRYQRKGFKLPDPALCLRADCYRESKVELGRFTFDGYCSEFHRGEVEGSTTEERQSPVSMLTIGA